MLLTNIKRTTDSGVPLLASYYLFKMLSSSYPVLLPTQTE